MQLIFAVMIMFDVTIKNANVKMLPYLLHILKGNPGKSSKPIKIQMEEIARELQK